MTIVSFTPASVKGNVRKVSQLEEALVQSQKALLKAERQAHDARRHELGLIQKMSRQDAAVKCTVAANFLKAIILVSDRLVVFAVHVFYDARNSCFQKAHVQGDNTVAEKTSSGGEILDSEPQLPHDCLAMIEAHLEEISECASNALPLSQVSNTGTAMRSLGGDVEAA